MHIQSFSFSACLSIAQGIGAVEEVRHRQEIAAIIQGNPVFWFCALPHFADLLAHGSSALTVAGVFCREAILKRLHLLKGDGTITLKGKVGCFIEAADMLVVTELMLSGGLNGLDVHQLAALGMSLVPLDRKV